MLCILDKYSIIIPPLFDPVEYDYILITTENKIGEYQKLKDFFDEHDKDTKDYKTTINIMGQPDGEVPNTFIITRIDNNSRKKIPIELLEKRRKEIEMEYKEICIKER